MEQNNGTPFVFISYAHSNNDKVLPIIQAMQRSGIQLWYDNGIEAGSEWPEFIADRVLNCQKFVLFVSNAYLNSQNCKRELNYAISRKKEILSIFLEEVNLTPGMEMQLGSYQAIFRNRFANDAAFCASISQEHFFDDCRSGAAQPVQQPTYQEPQPQSKPQNKYVAAVTETFLDSIATAPEPKNKYVAAVTNTFRESVLSHTQSQSQQSSTAANSATCTNGPAKKNRYIAAVLAFFLGWLGLHYFYLGHPRKGVIALLFCWTGITIYLGMGLGIYYLFMNEENFQQKCVAQKK